MLACDDVTFLGRVSDRLKGLFVQLFGERVTGKADVSRAPCTLFQLAFRVPWVGGY